jgi:hypothetical protein
VAGCGGSGAGGMMGNGRRLGFSRNMRSLWLLMALAVGLLSLISATRAEPGPGDVLPSLARDVGALRAHLETPLLPAPPPAARSAAFNADLGDGGPVFRQAAALRVARGARGRVQQLIGTYRDNGDERRARDAELLWLALHRIEHQLRAAVGAAGPQAELRDGGEAELAQLARLLAMLLLDPDSP